MKILDIIKENDQEHAQALRQTGFWGRAGAGCIFLALNTGRICIAHRSDEVKQPNTWGTWGGAIDSKESPKLAAQREVREEAGYHGAMKIEPLYVFVDPKGSGFKYYNFLAIVENEFEPDLNWETQDYDWFEFGKWPSPLHRGLVLLLQDSKSIEIIKKYVNISKQQNQDKLS